MQSRVLARVMVAACSESAPYFCAIEGALAAVETAVAISIAEEMQLPMLNFSTNFIKERIARVIRGDTNNLTIEEI